MRDRPNKTFAHVAEVDVQVFAAGRPPGLRHVLRKDFARANSFHKAGAEIANYRRDEIVRPQRVSRADRRRFLTQRTIDTTDHFGLTIEIDDPLFHQTRKLQVAIQLEQLLGREGGIFYAR